ncbi:N-acetyltransferase [Neobacillus mesonae]|nr:N-acetyltransferase [Neobacillus mesonae]
MKWTIRSEHPSDYHKIAELHAAAFSYSFGMGEAVLISMLRTRHSFDPELSLVAEQDGQLIGHILFTPQLVQVKKNTYQALILAPLAVHPDYQKNGVGSDLIHAGHLCASQKGFDLSIVLGHPHYYARFGYQGKAWMDEKVSIPFETIFTENSAVVRERRIEQSDIPAFISMWNQIYASAPFSLLPGHSILDWISPGASTITSAVMIDEALAGYIRYSKTEPEHISFIVTQDSQSLLQIANYYKQKLNPLTITHLSFPFPSASPLLEPFGSAFDVNISTYAEYMVRILEGPNHSMLQSLFADFEQGTSPRGAVIWPIEFDLC